MAAGTLERIVDRYERTSREFARRLEDVPAGGWDDPTPCAAWTVRALVNHVTRGNLNYKALA